MVGEARSCMSLSHVLIVFDWRNTVEWKMDEEINQNINYSIIQTENYWAAQVKMSAVGGGGDSSISCKSPMGGTEEGCSKTSADDILMVSLREEDCVDAQEQGLLFRGRMFLFPMIPTFSTHSHSHNAQALRSPLSSDTQLLPTKPQPREKITKTRRGENVGP